MRLLVPVLLFGICAWYGGAPLYSFRDVIAQQGGHLLAGLLHLHVGNDLAVLILPVTSQECTNGSF